MLKEASIVFVFLFLSLEIDKTDMYVEEQTTDDSYITAYESNRNIVNNTRY
jgi:hypothetical protein